MVSFISFSRSIRFNCDLRWDCGNVQFFSLFLITFFFLPFLCKLLLLLTTSGVTMVGGTAIKNPINQKFKICPNFNNKIKEKHCRSSLLCIQKKHDFEEIHCAELTRRVNWLYFMFLFWFSKNYNIRVVVYMYMMYSTRENVR